MKHRVKCTPAFVLSTIASFLLIVSVLFTSLQLSINNRAWFEREYEKLGLAQEIGISVSDSTNAIMRLIDYMEGRVDSIELTVHQNGEAVSMYNEREAEHMIDVRALYQAWRSVRTYGAILGIALLLGAFFLNKKDFLITLARSFLRASAAFGILLVGIGLFAAIDFNAFWTAFHYLFFTNDLWLLDPATDRMILICPERLFSDIVLRFASRFLLCFALMLAAAFWVKFRAKARYEHAR
jgi:integral membrane protein (TIGR01906 family)